MRDFGQTRQSIQKLIDERKLAKSCDSKHED